MESTETAWRYGRLESEILLFETVRSFRTTSGGIKSEGKGGLRIHIPGCQDGRRQPKFSIYQYIEVASDE